VPRGQAALRGPPRTRCAQQLASAPRDVCPCVPATGSVRDSAASDSSLCTRTLMATSVRGRRAATEIPYCCCVLKLSARAVFTSRLA
jgi:hypothetical protein